MAHAARVSESGLLFAEAQTRVAGAAFLDGALLSAVFDLPHELESLVVLRRSVPDAGGFASAELTLAPLASCLCGVNSEGIAVIATRDMSRDELSLRFHAQELLFRARDLAAGIEHVRRRAAYPGRNRNPVVAHAPGAASAPQLSRIARLRPTSARVPMSRGSKCGSGRPSPHLLTDFADFALESRACRRARSSRGTSLPSTASSTPTT